MLWVISILICLKCPFDDFGEDICDVFILSVLTNVVNIHNFVLV